MASQQMERMAELQDPEVRAELNRRVRECERKYFASGRLGLIPQASAHARQQITREKLRAGGVRVIQEQRAGDATKHGGPAGGYTIVPTMFL
jgi:hypothetical protein